MTTTGTALPPVAADLVATVVDALPARLRRKLDDTVAAAAAWPLVPGDGPAPDDPAPDGAVPDGAVQVDAGGGALVTLTVHGGLVRDAGDVTCSCLLAPRCLHRAAVVARCPAGTDDEVGDGTDAGVSPEDTAPGPGRPAADGPAVDGQVVDAPVVDARSGGVPRPGDDPGVVGPPGAVASAVVGDGVARAAGQVWTAVAGLLDDGVDAAGALTRASLLRGAHQAQVHGAVRLAGAARRVAGHVHERSVGGAGSEVVDLVADVAELLEVAAGLTGLSGADPAPLLGRARAAYTPAGGLRLHGVVTLPVHAGAVRIGVRTVLRDAAENWYHVTDVTTPPGGRRPGATTAVRLGTLTTTHRDLARGGAVVQGAEVSPTGALGSSSRVRAVAAPGCAWHEAPLDRLWHEPVLQQVHRAVRAAALPARERPVGADAVACVAEVLGVDAAGLVVVAPHGAAPVRLRAPGGGRGRAAWAALRTLGSRPGLTVRLIGAPDPGAPGVLRAWGVAPGRVPGADGPDAGPAGAGTSGDGLWPWPDAAHVDLGFGETAPGTGRAGHDGTAEERAVPATQAPPVPPATVGTSAVPVPSTALLEHQVLTALLGGRAAAARAHREAPALQADGLVRGAQLSQALAAAARLRARDVFGRATPDDGTGYAAAWLAVALYLRGARETVTDLAWGAPSPGSDPG